MDINAQYGEYLKYEGIDRAESNANHMNRNWSSYAMEYLLLFMDEYPGRVFLAEDVRYYATQCGLPKPPSNRAWGGVMTKASKRGIIKHVGFGMTRNPLAHRTPASLWRKF